MLANEYLPDTQCRLNSAETDLLVMQAPGDDDDPADGEGDWTDIDDEDFEDRVEDDDDLHQIEVDNDIFDPDDDDHMPDGEDDL
jgi:hypothetical protein